MLHIFSKFSFLNNCFFLVVHNSFSFSNQHKFRKGNKSGQLITCNYDWGANESHEIFYYLSAKASEIRINLAFKECELRAHVKAHTDIWRALAKVINIKIFM